MKKIREILEMAIVIIVGLTMAAIMLACWFGLGLFVYCLFN